MFISQTPNRKQMTLSKWGDFRRVYFKGAISEGMGERNHSNPGESAITHDW